MWWRSVLSQETEKEGIWRPRVTFECTSCPSDLASSRPHFPKFLEFLKIILPPGGGANIQHLSREGERFTVKSYKGIRWYLALDIRGLFLFPVELQS